MPQTILERILQRLVCLNRLSTQVHVSKKILAIMYLCLNVNFKYSSLGTLTEKDKNSNVVNSNKIDGVKATVPISMKKHLQIILFI